MIKRKVPVIPVDVIYVDPVTKRYVGSGSKGFPGKDHIGMQVLPDNAPKPLDVPCTWNGTSWDAIPETYDQKRAPELAKLRQQDQLDALLKLATMTDAQKAQVVPDKTADPGTPEWLIGNVNDIKSKYPKPTK